MLQAHPHRQAILEEVHARPIVIVPEVCRLRRLVLLPGNRDLSIPAIFSRFQQWCQDSAVNPPAHHTRQHTFTAGVLQATWEFHNEFVTVTWSAPLKDSQAQPAGIGLEAVGDLDLVCAVRLDIIGDTALPEHLMATFEPSSLCHVDVEGAKAQIASDFIEDADGFVRLEVAGGGLSTLRRSILARRLLEIESYSKLALLGLPSVRAVAADLQRLENEITAAISRLPEIVGTSLAVSAFAGLSELSLRATALTDQLSYRIAASKAYGQIVGDRIKALDDHSTSAGSSISVYLLNRLNPALRTINATEKRLENAAGKIDRAAKILNARNGLELEMQNSEILKTISQTAKSQFRLQQTVEGLSVIAISYYLLGILGYALTGPLRLLDWPEDTALSISTPFVVLAVWLVAHRFWGHANK